MKSKYSRNDYLYCADHTAKLVREQWIETIDHDRKWVEVEKEGGSNEVQARLFPGKLKSRWYGPFAVSKDMKNGAVKLYEEDGNEFIVNKQRVKPYKKDALIFDKDDDITLADEGEVT
ncbi:hypothetical protein Tco_1398765 [Tanacetum coccineum]